MLFNMSQYSPTVQKQSVIQTANIPSSEGTYYTFPIFVTLLIFCHSHRVKLIFS